MDKYIKKDDAIRAALKGASLHYHDQFGAVDIAAAIDELPTADVAPRAEVEELQAECNKWQERLKNECEYTEAITKKKVAREILDELEEVLCGEFLTERFWFDLGKLRIKYIEGQK